jgi:hypothetical protein
VIAGGVALRLVRFALAGSLSTDELFVAVNLRLKGFGDLHRDLFYDQVAPAGWLWLEKAAAAVSDSDAMLRLPSLVAGCLMVGLAAALARRLLSTGPALLVTLLVAGSPQLVYYSVQLKPYTIEAAACLLLILLAARVLESGRPAPMAAYWLGGTALAWLATTAMVVAASTGGLLLGLAVRDRDWRAVRVHLGGSALAVASWSALYAVRPQVAPWIYEYWSRTFTSSLAPRPLTPGAWLSWSVDVFVGFVSSTAGIGAWPWAAAVGGLMALGALSLAIGAPRSAALLGAPIIAAYLLALTRVYPMAERAALWLLPVALVFVGAAAETAWSAARRLATARPDRMRPGLRLAGAGLPIVIVAAAFGPQWARMPSDTNAERYDVAEEAITWIATHQRAGDRVYIRDSSTPLAVWYGPRAGLRWDGQYRTRRCRPDTARPDTAGPQLDGTSRIWLLLRAWGPARDETMAAVHMMMSRYGQMVDERWYGVFAVVLYRVDPLVEPPPDARCLVVGPVEYEQHVRP